MIRRFVWEHAVTITYVASAFAAVSALYRREHP